MTSKQCPYSVQLESEGGSVPVSLSYGAVVVGRGPFLEIRDSHVSRNHAELVVDALKDELLIRSLTANPTFVRKPGTDQTVVLGKGEELQLCPGDSFSFLPHSLEFRVQSSKVVEGAFIEQTLMMEQQTLGYDLVDRNTDQTLDLNSLEKIPEQTLDYKIMEKHIDQTLAYNMDDNHTEQTLGYSMVDAEEVATLEIDRNDTLMVESPIDEHASPSTEPILPNPSSPSTEPIIPNPSSPSTEPILPDPNSPSTEPIIPNPSSPSTEPILPDPNSPSTEPIIPNPSSPSTEPILPNPSSPTTEPILPNPSSPTTEPLTASLSTESSVRKKRKLPTWMLEDGSEEESKSRSKKPNKTKTPKKPSKPKPKVPATSPEPCSSTMESTKEEVPAKTDTLETGSSSPKPVSSSDSKASKEEDTTLPMCPYGPGCYRKNPDHLKNFSHASKPDATAAVKKECPYGSRCYRKNPAHFKEFSHSSGDSSDPRRREKKPRAAKAKKQSVLEGASDDDGENNAYDLKDDFIDDSGSDASESSTEVESSESDEWQPGEEVGGLVDDANAFMKNPKMTKKV